MKRFFVIIPTILLVATGCGSNNSSPSPLPPGQQNPNNPYYANNCYQGYSSDSVMVVRTNPSTGQREFGYIPRNLYTEDYARRVVAGEPGFVFCPVQYGSYGMPGVFDDFMADNYRCGYRYRGYGFYLPVVAGVWWGTSWNAPRYSGRWWKFHFHW